ncbi:nicotinate-nucleotide--dimethylbenzimidazole phosphoribosyltransferase [Pseudomonas aeruginosa VRFPA05]|nr:nicotinate-nucleotide--dimethylbenzimidazole phosphoribosyltransferase [Pseudomonas aeruginosa VRFPA05]
MSLQWWRDTCREADPQMRRRAAERQDRLTKPRGSLGRLEQVAIDLAALQGRERPSLERLWVTVFAGDHGVVAEGVSAYPQAVTGEMLRNFVRGGAAISVLARELGAGLEVVDLGTAVPLEALPGVRHLRLAAGTANFVEAPAMGAEQCLLALEAGRESVRRAEQAGSQLFIGGEMGIGNTTAAAAMACALLDAPASALVGPGTRARDYWLERLPRLPDAPALPLACAPESIRQPRTRRLAFQLSAGESRRLERLAAQHGVTLSSVFGCAFALVLARWSESAEFLLNVPLFDRHADDPRIGEVIADFTTLLLLECRMQAGVSFAEAVKSFQRNLHGAIDHAAFPALEVLREARRRGQPRSAPVVFASNLGEEGFVPAAFRDAFGDLHDMLSQTPQVWLDHQLYRVGDGILLAWDSVVGLFPEGLPETMFEAYVGLLQRLCDSAWEQPADLLLPWAQQARRALLNGQPACATARTLHSDFFLRAAEAPDADALLYRDQRVTRGELAERALRIAGGLREAGVRPGDAVEVSLPRGPQQVAAVFGVLAAGACYVPLDIDQPPARRRLIEEAAGVCLAITEEDDPQALPPRLDVQRLLRGPALAAPVPLAPQASAYVIYTSGSTGVPKGVEVSHAAAINTIDALLDLLRVDASDRLLAVSALDFDLSVFDLFGGLGAGASLVLPAQEQARDAAAWAEAIQRHAVSLWNSAPALLEMALSLPASQADYRSLRAVLLSGDWVALDLPGRLRPRCAEGCRLHVLGGATEAGIWSNLQSVDTVPPHWRSIPYGRALPGQAYRVVDAHGRDVPDLVVGELWIGGASLARGYRNDPELSARRFVHDAQGRWYRTGDRGRYWGDGTLEFLGRVDQQVKVRGQRIELGEVEAALCAQAGVESACAAVLGGGVASLGAVLVPRWRHGPKAPWNCRPHSGSASACGAAATSRVRGGRLVRSRRSSRVFHQTTSSAGNSMRPACSGTSASRSSRLPMRPWSVLWSASCGWSG